MSDTQHPLLEVRNLCRKFGGITAIRDFSLKVQPGTIHGLIGPNGAGKTTTFNVISGYYPPTTGQILWQGQDISSFSTNARAQLGLIRTFQHTTLFQEFTVLDNVRLGCHMSSSSSFLSRILRTDRDVEASSDRKAKEILEFFDLAALAEEQTVNLPHGHQRALGMAVALAADPKLILLDEPFTGMNPEETRRMMELVRQVRDRGVTIMLVEHDMQAVMGLCDIITVLNFGTLLAEGLPEEIRNNQTVVEAYLGPAHVA